MSEPLRKCRVCGLEAYTIIDLNKFVKNKSCKHDRENYCFSCRNKRLKKTPLSYLRKCRVCGLEVHTEEELNLFKKSRKVPYGREALCKRCHNQINRIQDSHNKKENPDRHRLSRIYVCMKQRCYNPNQTGFENYGGRGITVCDEWRNDKESFIEWALANDYQGELEIDRIDNDKGYSPENCRWVNDLQQARNKRDTVTFWDTKTKICPGCKRLLSFDDFYKDKSQVDGMNARCKECQIKHSIETKRKRHEHINCSGSPQASLWCS